MITIETIDFTLCDGELRVILELTHLNDSALLREKNMLDQTSRYSDLTLKEEDLIAGEKHVLAAYKMKPAVGFFDYIGTAAHFCAESSTGTNVQTVTTDDFAMGLDAICYEIDEEKELMKIAFPVDLFDRMLGEQTACIG